MSITKTVFDTARDGTAVHAYTMTNATGVSATVLSYGGILQKLLVPDASGKVADCICGYDDLNGYRVGGGYHGALIGRYANRIAEGKFTLDGKEYILAKNEKNITHLHGGDVGFDQKIWDVTAVEGDEEDRLTLHITSPDGEEGYPGTMDLTVTYTLRGAVLSIHYLATADAPTVCSLTNHGYFNMAGFDGGSILDQELMIAADFVTEMDELLIPTGKLIPVDGTPFDFRVAKPVGRDIDSDDQQMLFGGGYDHNFVLRTEKTAPASEPFLAASLRDPKSGRKMEVLTNLPGVQLYTANGMDTDYPFKGGHPQQKRHALCLETQLWPDGPHHDSFPSAVLRPGEAFDYTTVLSFSW